MTRLAIAFVAFAFPFVAAGCAADAQPDDTATDGAEIRGFREVRHLAQISDVPNSFLIGNALPGWHVEASSETRWGGGPGNTHGHCYQRVHVFGDGYDHTGWVVASTIGGKDDPAHCGSTYGTSEYQAAKAGFLRTYTNGDVNEKTSDGSFTQMDYAAAGCRDHERHANVESWRVPATPHDAMGTIPDHKTLYWRYVTKDGKWVLVHDAAFNGSSTIPNWYFVQRACLDLSNRH